MSLGPDADKPFGQRGPSQEAAIGAALALDRAEGAEGVEAVEGVEGVVAMFADYDGSDGGTAIADGLVDSSTATQARKAGVSLRKGLVHHQTTATLQACGDAVPIGASATNASDLVVIAIR